ncbi:MAG: uncharacterized protein JWN25_1037, partial [Verrucomicrobiales bacterium]|nr:uncharacterized protein [Verrucomicrobiales bacterium]
LSTSVRPDIFIAEPVGSCTDLVATVSYPLRRIYGDRFVISPLSVVLDPVRAMSILGLDQGKTFSAKVVYIYLKQLEEADILVINKSDVISEEQRRLLGDELIRRFPRAKIFVVSSRTGDGLEAWFTYLLTKTQSHSETMEVDYQVYAEGEALLGWLNCTVEVKSLAGSGDGNELLQGLGTALHAELAKHEVEVAHLKMTLAAEEALTDTAVVNLVRNNFQPEISQRLEDPISCGEIIVNLRAEADPQQLKQIVEQIFSVWNNELWQMEVTHLEHFRPGKPVPTHRIQEPPPFS